MVICIISQAASDALALAVKLSKKLEGPYKVSRGVIMIFWGVRWQALNIL
jgi:hypothetical protein